MIGILVDGFFISHRLKRWIFINLGQAFAECNVKLEKKKEEDYHLMFLLNMVVCNIVGSFLTNVFLQHFIMGVSQSNVENSLKVNL